MKTITLKNFAGLTYVTVTKVPVKESPFGEVIDTKPRELEKLVSMALIKYKIPITGAEFRVFKSAIGLSNQAIGDKIGVSRNTVLKWGQNLKKRLPAPYEMLVRLFIAESLGLQLELSIDELRPKNKTKKINVKAA